MLRTILVSLLCVPLIAAAQPWPGKLVRLIAPQPSEALGQPIVVN